MERIFRFDAQGNLEEIPRNPLRRYRYRPHPLDPTELIYLEFTDVEEAARTAEEALPPPPFGGAGRVIVTRLAQPIPSNAVTLLIFDTLESDNAGFRVPANPDRLVVPPRQGGLLVISLEVRFDEGSAGAGAGVGDRAVGFRIGPQTLRSPSQRARSSGDTELAVALERDVVAGALLRFGVFQSSGQSMNVDARAALRRVLVSE